jgi:type IV pilus assembly protein PilW
MREEVPELPEVCVGTGGNGKDPNLELAFAMQTPLVSGLGAELNALLGSSWCNGSQASTPAAAEEFVAIRRASTCAAGSAADNNCPEIGDFFHLQVSGCSDPNNGEKAGQVKLERVTEATVNSVLNLRRFGCHSGASEPAPIYRYISRIYYVNQDDQLIRLQLEASGTYAQQVMAEGIEALRFEWLIDHDPAEKAGASSESGPNGTYDSIRSSSDDNWTALDRQTDWEHIVGARVWMVTRSVAPVAGYIDTNTYDIPGQAWSNDQPDHTRMLRSKTVDVVNTAGRRR